MYFGSLFEVIVHHGQEVMGHLVTLYLQSGSSCAQKAQVFFKSGTPSHGIVLPTFMVSHPCDQLFWKQSHRYI